MALIVLGCKRVERIVAWWTPRRFEMALALVMAQRLRRGLPATRERIALAMSSNPTQLRRYLVGETRKPSARSVVFLDSFFTHELGREWIELVDAAIAEEGGNEDWPAHTASAAGVF